MKVKIFRYDHSQENTTCEQTVKTLKRVSKNPIHLGRKRTYRKGWLAKTSGEDPRVTLVW